MVALVTVQVAGSGLDAMSKAWQVATVFDFTVFAGATLVLSAGGSQHGAATRRLGAACGFVVGGLLYLPHLLQSLDPTRGVSGGAGVFGDGPVLLIPLLLGAVAGWIGRSGAAVIRTALWAAVTTGIVFIGG